MALLRCPPALMPTCQQLAPRPSRSRNTSTESVCHSAFSRPEALRAIAERAGADCLVVDPWNALGTGQVFAYVSEVVALRA